MWLTQEGDALPRKRSRGAPGRAAAAAHGTTDHAPTVDSPEPLAAAGALTGKRIHLWLHPLRRQCVHFAHHFFAHHFGRNIGVQFLMSPCCTVVWNITNRCVLLSLLGAKCKVGMLSTLCVILGPCCHASNLRQLVKTSVGLIADVAKTPRGFGNEAAWQLPGNLVAQSKSKPGAAAAAAVAAGGAAGGASYHRASSDGSIAGSECVVQTGHDRSRVGSTAGRKRRGDPGGRSFSRQWSRTSVSR